MDKNMPFQDIFSMEESNYGHYEPSSYQINSVDEIVNHPLFPIAFQEATESTGSEGRKNKRLPRQQHCRGSLARHVFSDILLKFKRLFFSKKTKSPKNRKVLNQALIKAFKDGYFKDEIIDISQDYPNQLLKFNMGYQYDLKRKDRVASNEIMKMLTQIRRVFSDSPVQLSRIKTIFSKKVKQSISQQENKIKKNPLDKEGRERCIENLKQVELMLQHFLNEGRSTQEFIQIFYDRNSGNHSSGTRKVQKSKAQKGKNALPLVLGQDIYDVLQESALVERAANIESDSSTRNLSLSIQ